MGNQAGTTSGQLSQGAWTAERMTQRIIRYKDMRAFNVDFVDTRQKGSGPDTPEQRAKEFVSMIAPGGPAGDFSNPLVHVQESHGFHVMGSRQTPNLINSQHIHKTSEIWVCHTGRWRIDFGENCEDATVMIDPGDVISIPVNIFRSSTNVGNGIGFLWSIVGRDDPGRLTWAPKVFETAREYGLVLLKSGKMIDTSIGEKIPPGDAPMDQLSPKDLQSVRRVTQDEANSFVVRGSSVTGEARIIGKDAPLNWSHGLTLSRLNMSPGQTVPSKHTDVQEAIFLHSGDLAVRWPEAEASLGVGDTMTVPTGVSHAYSSKSGATVFIVRRSDY